MLDYPLVQFLVAAAGGFLGAFGSLVMGVQNKAPFMAMVGMGLSVFFTLIAFGMTASFGLGALLGVVAGVWTFARWLKSWNGRR
jgi:hypothetical protein